MQHAATCDARRRARVPLYMMAGNALGELHARPGVELAGWACCAVTRDRARQTFVRSAPRVGAASV